MGPHPLTFLLLVQEAGVAQGSSADYIYTTSNDGAYQDKSSVVLYYSVFMIVSIRKKISES